MHSRLLTKQASTRSRHLFRTPGKAIDSGGRTRSILLNARATSTVKFRVLAKWRLLLGRQRTE